MLARGAGCLGRQLFSKNGWSGALLSGSVPVAGSSSSLSKPAALPKVADRSDFPGYSHVAADGPLGPGIGHPQSLIIPEMNRIPCARVTTLSNGVRVVSNYVHSEMACVGLWLDAGSRFETAENNGTAHFLEHLIFKGTKKRSRVQLEKEVENMGGSLNAYTSREQTVYYANVQKADAVKTVGLLGDIIQNSKLEKDDIEQERAVILREMEEVNKNHDEVLLDRMHLSSFRGHSLSYTILGPEQNIRRISRDDLTKYVARNYRSDRMVLVAAGQVDHGELVKAAEQHFGAVPRSEPDSGEVNPNLQKPFFYGSEFVTVDNESGPTGHVCVAMEAVPWHSPDAVTFMLMSVILGHKEKYNSTCLPYYWSGNRTVNNVSRFNGMKGCAERYRSFLTMYKDTGLFGWIADIDEMAVDHAVGELMWGITAMSYTVTEEEVQMAKRQLLNEYFQTLDTTIDVAEDVGRQMLVYGRRIHPMEFVKRLDAIDAEEVKRVAWERLHDAEVSIAGVGPVQFLPNLYMLQKKTVLFRY